MPNEPDLLTHRILVIDDNPAIHQDYRKILVADGKALTSCSASSRTASEKWPW